MGLEPLPESNNKDRPHFALTRAIVGGFYDVYNQLGRGFLESVYERALQVELARAGLKVSRQHPVVVYFKGDPVGHFRADLMINDSVIVELKVAKRIHTRHRGQLINILRATGLEVGLLLNFGPTATFKRIVYSNDHRQSEYQ